MIKILNNPFNEVRGQRLTDLSGFCFFIMVEDYQENYGYGWISLYRSIKNHWVFENDKYFKWWVIMLFEVNHSDKKITRYYEVYDIKKGQSCNCLRTWATLFKTTPKTVSKFFSLLEKDGMITSSKIGKGKQALTLININKYIDYQSKSKQGLLQEVNKEETESKQDLPTNNNVNNYNNYNKENKNEIFYFELLDSEEWLGNLTMQNQNKFDLQQVKEKLLIFKNELNLKFDNKSNKKEFASHFVSWLNQQKNEKRKPFFDSPA